MTHLRRWIAALLTVAALFGLCATTFAANTFDYDDYKPADWYFRYLEKATDAGWMNGVGDKTFDPNGTLSRAMFVTILHRIAGTPAAQSAAAFSDVAAGSWYEAAVNWAAQNGVVNGYPDGRFGVNDPLTREQMAAILFRYAGIEKKDVSGRGDTSAFADGAAVSAWAKDAIAWAVAAGVISGSGDKLMPQGTSTRAQAAAVLVRYESAEETATLTRADLEKALIETAWAYSLKETKIQYDSQNITPGILNKYFSGSWRLTEDVAPEYGARDNTIFSVCSDYVQKTYYNTLNERFFGYSLDWVTRCLWNNSKNVYGKDVALVRYWNDERIVKEYGDENKYTTKLDKRVTAQEMREFFQNWEKNMRPGDVLVPAGHAMLYIGNGRVLDCAGGKYDMDTGKDIYEGRGAVSFLHDVIECYVDGTDANNKNSYSFPAEGDPKVAWFLVMRPLDAITIDDGDGDPGNDKVIDGVSLTPSVRSRAQYKAMEIDRSVNITPFGTAVSGDTLTYTISIRNASNAPNYLKYRRVTDPAYAGETYTALPVTERIPDGTELVAGSITEGGVYSDGEIRWTLDIPADGFKTLQYTVKVTAVPGETIVSGGGKVADIPSNEIRNYVGGAPLGDETVQAMNDFYHCYDSDWQKSYGLEITDDTSVIEQIYDKAFGKTLELDTLQQLFDGIYEQVHIQKESGVGYMRGSSGEGWPYTLKADAYEKYPMLVRRYLGGKSTWFASDQQRINEFNIEYLRPGDVVFCLTLDDYNNAAPRKVKSAVLLLCLDETHYAMYNTATGEFTRGRGGKEHWKALTYDAFFVLRPSQTGALADSGHLVKPEGIAAANAESKQMRQQAIVATAWAYYDKGEKLQLDQCQLSKVATGSGGNVRNQYFAAPETITSDKNWYGSVHGLAVTVFKNALDHEFSPTSTHASYNRIFNLLEDYNTAYKWASEANTPRATPEELFAMLEPGDILDIVRTKLDYIYAIYLGDGMLMSYSHENSQRYDLENGIEHAEPDGAAFLLDFEKDITADYLAGATQVLIARFVDDVEYDQVRVTPSARSRLAYPRMVIDRTVNVGPFGDALTGDTLTYTIAITNKSNAPYSALPVTEQVPAGTTLVAAEGAQNADGKLTWTLDVPAGETKTVSYSVTVTAQPGERIVNDGGFVAEIPSNVISTTVVNPLITAEATARMEKLAAMDDAAVAAELKLDGKSAVDAIRGAYAYVVTGDSTKDAKALIAEGKELRALFESSGKNSLGLYTMPASYDANKTLYASLVDGYYGGYNVHCDIARYRLMELATRHLKPGEVLVKVGNESTTYCLYLGGDTFLSVSDAEPTLKIEGTKALEESFKTAILYFALLRPAQTSANLE